MQGVGVSQNQGVPFLGGVLKRRLEDFGVYVCLGFLESERLRRLSQVGYRRGTKQVNPYRLNSFKGGLYMGLYRGPL